MEIKEGDEVVYSGKWWIVQEIFPDMAGLGDECAIIDEDGEEKIVFTRHIDHVLPYVS